MKIIELKVTDLKRIHAVDIVPRSNLVEIAGNNGEGKTSILDAIWYALGGKANIPREPVRGGAEEAVIEMTVGDYIITRRIQRDGKTTISVANADGMRAAKPQDVLDSLVGDLTFDPLLFIRKPVDQQLEMLRGFADGVDFDDMDAREKEAFNARRDHNRDVKSLQAIVDAAPKQAADVDVIDMAALEDRLAKTQTRNQRIRDATTKRAAEDRELAEATERRANNVKRAEELRAEAAELIAAAKEHDDRANELTVTMGDLQAVISARKQEIPPLVDESAILKEMREAREHNQIIAGAALAMDRAKVDRERLATAQAAAKKADDTLESIREEREKALKSIHLPIKGLEIKADGIDLNGHPLEQASDAQQLRVGIALAMKANPKLRVIRIRDGSLLDDAAMEALRDMADTEDFQLWIERVGAGGADAIVIEDGRVKGAEDPAPKAAAKKPPKAGKKDAPPPPAEKQLPLQPPTPGDPPADEVDEFADDQADATEADEDEFD